MKKFDITEGQFLFVAHWGGIKWPPAWVRYIRTLKSGLLRVVVIDGPDEGQMRSVAWNQCTHFIKDRAEYDLMRVANDAVDQDILGDIDRILGT